MQQKYSKSQKKSEIDGSSDERLLLTMYPAEPLIVKNKINR